MLWQETVWGPRPDFSKPEAQTHLRACSFWEGVKLIPVPALLLLLLACGIIVFLLYYLYKMLKQVRDLSGNLPNLLEQHTDDLGHGIAAIVLALERVQQLQLKQQFPPEMVISDLLGRLRHGRSRWQVDSSFTSG